MSARTTDQDVAPLPPLRTCMERFERLLCLMQPQATSGIPARSASNLDGDGADRFRVKESLRKYRDGAMKIRRCWLQRRAGDRRWLFSA